MQLTKKQIHAALAAVLISFAVVEPSVAASAGSDEFSPLWELVSAMCQGYLGKSIAVCFLLVGLAMGVIRGSVIAAVSSISAGISLLLAPTIIDAMFSAT